MEQTPTYIIVRDTDVDALTDAVNERIDEGYELAGPLVCVPAVGGQPPMFMQPLTLAAAEEEGEEDEDADEYEDDEAAEEEESEPAEDVVVYRRRR